MSRPDTISWMALRGEMDKCFTYSPFWSILTFFRTGVYYKQVYFINLFTGANITTEELDGLKRDIVQLKRAVRKADPFLRSIIVLRAYAVMSIPLGILCLVFCLGSHFLIRSYGSFQAIPSAWKTPFGAALALIVIGSSILKWIVVNRRAAEIEKGANFMTALKAMYGSSWVNINLPASTPSPASTTSPARRGRDEG